MSIYCVEQTFHSVPLGPNKLFIYLSFLATSPNKRRCPFLDPVKRKHAYRVPRGGHPTFAPMPIFRESADPAAMAAQLYSSMASSKAKERAANAAVSAERKRLGNANGVRNRRSRGKKGADGGEVPLVLEFPPSLKVIDVIGCPCNLYR